MSFKKPVIAVDLDDVLAINVPAFVEFSNKKWGMNLTLEKYEENWMKTWGVDWDGLAERTEVIKNEFWQTLQHVDEALPVLKNLSETYKLVIATSRRREVSQVTKDWINEHFGGLFKEIHHAGIFDDYTGHADYHNRAIKATKAELCKQIGADYLIDDHPKHCLGANAVGVKAILFGNYPWNRNIEIPQEIIRLQNWAEIKEYFTNET